MIKSIATIFVAIILAVFCLMQAPPKAWEVQNLTSKKHIARTIPNLKKLQKYDWYEHPPKRLKDYGTSSAEIAHDAKKFKTIKSGFEALKRSTRRIQRNTITCTLAANRSLNRSRNLFAYDETRSCRDIPHFYINSNDVYTPYQRYMVCQGPLDTTVNDFWKAVLHNNSQIIVTLVMAIENGKDKCASYWTYPIIQCEDWTITLHATESIAKSSLIPSHQIVIRTFIAQNAHEKRIIKQIHYENWPDGKIPELELFIKLLDIVDLHTSDKDFPITVHCSAGIGRSGTFVAAHSLRKEIRQYTLTAQNKKPLLINIPKAIFLLRCQRVGLVGSSGQYQTVYQAIAKEHQPRRLPYFVL